MKHSVDAFPAAAWRSPLRQELLDLFFALPLRRAPALRRSSRADWLFATDLPSCAAPEDCSAFLCLSEEKGWQAQTESGWMELRKPGILLPAEWFAEPADGEAACLGSLCARHPEREEAPEAVFRLIKAREEGPAAWEEACRALHGECARRLRLHLPLPRLFPEASPPVPEYPDLKEGDHANVD